MGVDPADGSRLAATLPFMDRDATCGSENELQAVVRGPAGAVDLPLTIANSNYHQNLVRRHQRGETPLRVLSGLDSWLRENPDQVWDHSWVRLPLERLSPAARQVWERDRLADKAHPALGPRGDVDSFQLAHRGQAYLRVPVSYLLKLALADALGCQEGLPPQVTAGGRRMMEHFLSDNTSPETFSFHLADSARQSGLGAQAAAETGKRLLLVHLVLLHAGLHLGLWESGQRPVAFMAPNVPSRLRWLSRNISDSFYRDLFMSPCLSGWDRGEEKHHYMHLCHQVLSRAQFNALLRLREAGIITRNLVVLPGAGNASLANNGTHLSLGSRMMTRALADPATSGLGPREEKYLGDLAIKIVEHFLPLFVGTLSAAPYRLDFSEFHPESVLGFLPFELDYSHLRMLWRRWRKKAHLKNRLLGLRLTPFGPPWLDSLLSRALGLKGDWVPDFRLLDYPVAFLSTDQSPALDGSLGNDQLLKRDLAALGGFDPRMAVYLLYRQRDLASRGFSGFEGRHHSLFPGLTQDLAPAVDLQRLITAFAMMLMAQGRVSHWDIPDDPQVESERRQIFFASAIGLPTFFVRADSGNHFLMELVKATPGVRPSRRYPGCLRVRLSQFRQALVDYLAREGAPLVEALGLEPLLKDMGQRLNQPREFGAGGRLTTGILEQMGTDSALAAPADQFNLAAETYYRETLRRRHLREALDSLTFDLREAQARRLPADLRLALGQVMQGRDPLAFLLEAREPVVTESATSQEVLRLINLLIISLEADARREAQGEPREEARGDSHEPDAPSVHRA